MMGCIVDAVLSMVMWHDIFHLFLNNQKNKKINKIKMNKKIKKKSNVKKSSIHHGYYVTVCLPGHGLYQ